MKIVTRWASLASLITVVTLAGLPHSMWAQTADEAQESSLDSSLVSSIVTLRKPAATSSAAQSKLSHTGAAAAVTPAKLDFDRVQARASIHLASNLESKDPFGVVDQIADANVGHSGLLPPVAPYLQPMQPALPPVGPRIQWVSLVKQSLFFLAIQHSFRFATEPGTREELKGPFFKDWGNSILGYNGWRDGDPFIVNYVGHPMMGSITGWLEIQNDRDSKALTFGWNHAYWKSRGRAMAYSAVYSALFEVGPISEASLGNVGLDERTSGMVDLIVTPTIGTGWLIAEDLVDRYIIAKLEPKIANRPIRIFMRGFLNPSRSFANMMAGKEPWLRRDRGGVWNDRR